MCRSLSASYWRQRIRVALSTWINRCSRHFGSTLFTVPRQSALPSAHFLQAIMIIFMRWNAKVGKNRAEFWTVLPSQILLVKRASQKLYPSYHACLPARRLVKVRWIIPTSPKVIGTPALNFKPNFKCPPLQFWGTIPSQFGFWIFDIRSNIFKSTWARDFVHRKVQCAK